MLTGNKIDGLAVALFLRAPPLDGENMALGLILLWLTAAPFAIDIVAEPYTAVLISALHGAIVDRTPTLVIAVPIAAIALLGLAILLPVGAFAEAIWFAAHLLKMDDGTTCLFEQILTCPPRKVSWHSKPSGEMYLVFQEAGASVNNESEL